MNGKKGIVYWFSFGNGMARVDGLRLFVKDLYADVKSTPAECSSDVSAGFVILNALLSGKIGITFSVAH